MANDERYSILLWVENKWLGLDSESSFTSFYLSGIMAGTLDLYLENVVW